MTFKPISGSTTWRKASRTLSAALGSSESISQIVRGTLSVSAMHSLLRHRRHRERTVDVAVEQAGDPLHRQGEGRGDERLVDHADFRMLLAHAEVGAAQLADQNGVPLALDVGVEALFIEELDQTIETLRQR